MAIDGWQDDYLPTVPHCWASTIDPYRINDILWEVPFFPGIHPWPVKSRLWIIERFSLPQRLPWCKNFAPILKDWIFNKNPAFWTVLERRFYIWKYSATGTLPGGPFDYFVDNSSLVLELEGNGEIGVTFLYEAGMLSEGRLQTTLENAGKSLTSYSFFNENSILKPTRLDIFPEKSCDEEFKYSFPEYRSCRYFRRGYLRRKIDGQEVIDLSLKPVFTDAGQKIELSKRILLGSVVAFGEPSLVQQAQQQLGWYLAEKQQEMLQEIDDFVDFSKFNNLLAAQGVYLSEIGHLYKAGDLNASLSTGDAIYFGWRIFPAIAIPNSGVQTLKGYWPSPASWDPILTSWFDGEITHTYPWLCVIVVPNNGDVVWSDILNRMPLDGLRIDEEEIENGVLKAAQAFHTDTRKGHFTYLISKWEKFPNILLDGAASTFGAGTSDFGRNIRLYAVPWSSPFEGEEGWFMKFAGGYQIIPDPFRHFPFYGQGGPFDLQGTPWDPNYSDLACHVTKPFPGHEWIDLDKISPNPWDPDRRLVEGYLGHVGLIDRPRLFYPAINDLWDSGEEALETDARPYRIEWVKRFNTGWKLRHGATGRTLRLDQIALGGWVDYLQQPSPGANWEKITPYPFNEAVIESWLYTVWSKVLELEEKWASGEIPEGEIPQEYELFVREAMMAIDSPRLIELHHALNAREFAYLPDSTGEKPDRVWTLGNMIDMIAQVLGVCFNPDGTIRSIRQKSVIRSGEKIPVGWAFGQWGINEVTPGDGVNTNGPQLGGTPGEKRPGIVYENRSNRFDEDPYTGEPSKILPGDYVLCESWPQYIDQMLDDLDHALNLQELGALAVPAADGTEKKALIEGLGAVVSELLYMLSAISQQTAQTQVSSLKNQAMNYELLKALGLPLVSQTFPVDLGFDGEPPYSVPFPGLAADSPSLTQLFGAILANLALLQSAILKIEPVTRDEAEEEN